MTQTVPAAAILGLGATGLTIGLRVLNLDGTEYSAFSTTGVVETSTAGTYRKTGGVVVPAAGGYIVWGTAVTDYAEATVPGVAAQDVAEAVLLADWEAITGTVPDRSMLNALRFVRNKWAATNGTLKVYEEDDTTVAWEAMLTTNAGADRITGSTPGGTPE